MSECLMYGLDLEARSLATCHSEDCIRLLVGTNNVKTDNQVYRLEVEPEFTRISARQWRHPAGEAVAVAAAPHSHDVLATAAADYRLTSPSHGVHLWRMAGDSQDLLAEAAFATETPVTALDWSPVSSRGVAAHGGCVAVLDMCQLQPVSVHPVEGAVRAAVWSPHHDAHALALAVERDAVQVDTREKGVAVRIADAHSHRCLHVDWNPNRPHVLATAGDDGAVRVWDVRSPSSPVWQARPHGHWAWQVRFHPVHDQLLLSAGSDACLVLSCARSVSSEAPREGERDEEEEEDEEESGVAPLEDGQLERIEEHEESVYSCVWAAADPWAFASLSMDGRVVISRVSRQHKYALMQL